MITNPYKTGLPLIGGSSFIGRKDILKILFNEILTQAGGARISLFGARNIGTTSVLLSITNPEIQSQYSGINSNNKYFFIIIDFKELPTITRNSLENLMLEKFGLHLTPNSNFFTIIKNEINRIIEEGKKVVFLFDEVDGIEDLGNDYLYFDVLLYNLGIRYDDNVSIITASKRPLLEIFYSCQQNYPKDLKSPYYLHFHSVLVGLFRPQEVNELVINVSESHGCSLKQYKRRLIKLAGSYPHFLQLACSIAFKELSDNNSRSKGLWTKIEADFDHKARNYYRDFMQHFTEFEKQIVLEIAFGYIPESLPIDSDRLLKTILKDLKKDNSMHFQKRDALNWAVHKANIDLAEYLILSISETDFLSEWILSIFQVSGNTIKLFSSHFENFIKSISPETQHIIKINQLLPIIKLLNDNLRKYFDVKPPNHESEVQRAIQLILDAASLSFFREGEQLPFSIKFWRPDHTSTNVAIEVKLCRSAQQAKKIVEEISADILAYKSRFASILFVVYDLGHIVDEVKFRSDFEKEENVFILIRKH